MKLFANDPPYTLTQSACQFKQMYASSSVVSTESISLFFAKVQDSFSDALDSVVSPKEQYVLEALSQKRVALLQAKQVKFQDFSHEVVSKPELFQGYYTDYLKAMLLCVQEVAKKTEHLIETLRMTVATFINEYSDDKVDQIFGAIVYQNATKSLPDYKSQLTKFTKAPSGKFKTKAGDVLKSLQDIPTLFSQVELIESVFSKEGVARIQQQVHAVSELIDSLVEVNLTSGVLTRSEHSKQKLIEAIHITAQYVEYYHVLLAQWVLYCKAFNELTQALIKFPTSK